MTSPKLNLPLQTLFFLRFAQLACTTLSTYASIFYISFYVHYRRQASPRPHYFFLFTTLLIALEFYITTSYTIRSLTSSHPKINYRWYAITTGALTLLSWYSYSWMRTIPYLTEYNEGNNSGIYFYKDSVEHGTCAINDMIIVAGGLNIIFTLLITLWAILGHSHAEGSSQGSIRLPSSPLDSNPDATLPFSSPSRAQEKESLSISA